MRCLRCDSRPAALFLLVALLVVALPAAAHADGGGAVAPGSAYLGVDESPANPGDVPAGTPSGGATTDDKPPRRSRRASKRRKRRAARRGDGGTPVPKPRPKPDPEPAPKPEPGGSGSEAGHFFPVNGTFDFGGEGSRFGAGRVGHTHQGQDIAAAKGTPVVAPFAGTVEWVRFQREGAGWYIVLDGDGEDRDYVFMHLRRGTLLVTPGQQVAAGEQIAQVGNTGRSFGPHLHFEIWVGGWYVKGGAPVDPLPILKSWLIDAAGRAGCLGER